MYTGYSIQDQTIIRRDEGKTEYYIRNSHIHDRTEAPTGYYLVKGLSPGVRHINGPDGYTKFYVKDGHIYGPSILLPWLGQQDEPEDLRARA